MKYTIVHEKRTGAYVLIDEDEHRIVGYYDTIAEAEADVEEEVERGYEDDEK